MKKFGRFLLIALGGLVALAIVILLAVNLYVQSQATQARIQQELSHRLGAPLRIKQISVTPWGGLKLSGITIPQTLPGKTGDFLEAQTFRLRIRFGSLFGRRLVIKEVSLVRPKVVWLQNMAGKWRLPEARRPIRPPAPPVTARQPAPPPSLATASPVVSGTPVVAETAAPAPVAVAPAPAPRPFVPEVRRVTLSDGDLEFLSQGGKPVATFSGVNFRSSLRNGTAVTGTIRIDKTALRDRFFLTKLESPLQYDPAILDFSKISAKAAGGQITGRFVMRPQEENSPFQAEVHFEGLQAAELIKEAGGPEGMLRGKLEGSLVGAGQTADPNALTGHGKIYLREGQVQQYSLLVALGQLLQIEELTQLHLNDAHVKYHITPGVITVDDLLLQSPNIRLSATGKIRFDGKMRLEAQLALSEKVRAQLFSALRNNFTPTNEPGYSAISFQVKGTVDRPKTNLMDKLVGQDLKDIGSMLNSLFGKKKKPEAVEESPTPAPTETPATPSATP